MRLMNRRSRMKRIQFHPPKTARLRPSGSFSLEKVSMRGDCINGPGDGLWFKRKREYAPSLGGCQPTLSRNYLMRINAQKMAARLGLEPRQNESESFVLPLHHRAVEIFALRHEAQGGSATALEPAMGFEPATACLQNRCSAVELRRQDQRAAFCQVHVGKNSKFGGSPGTRTPNLLIKSQLLYH